MKKQNGQALILVLILLALGALLIVPSLKYTFTGMRSVGVSENALTNLYAADGVIEDALLRLLNEYMGNFDPSNPVVGYNFQYGDEYLSVTITIPEVPASQNYGQGQVHNLRIDIVPNWLDPPPAGESSPLNYIIRFNNQPWSFSSFKFTLPKGLTYSSSSNYLRYPDKQADCSWEAEVDLVNHKVKWTNGQWQNQTLWNYTEVYSWPPDPYNPATSYLYIKTEADGRQTLEYRPVFSPVPTGNRTFIQTVQVSGTPPWGINNLIQSSFVGGFGAINIPQTSAVGVAMYAILIPIGGVTYQVVVGYDTATGSFKIVSYNVVE